MVNTPARSLRSLRGGGLAATAGAAASVTAA